MKRVWSILARAGGSGLLFFSACTPKLLTPPPAPITLSGVVQLAPVKNERVKAYRVLPTGEVSGSSAAEGLTDANGNFSLSVPPGTYVIKTEGVGEHLDEATQQWQPACELTALVNTQETQEVPVTPMTALLKERALTLVRESGMTLTEAKALAEEEVAPKFNLNVEDLNQLPVSPWGISDMSALERSSKRRRIKIAEKLAVFSQFVNEFSFTGLSANEKLSKLMQALQADFKDDGKINGSVSGALGLIAKKAALRWRAGMNAARTATRSPSSALAFKDSNIQEDVESVTGAVTSEEDRFDTGSEIEGWHTDGVYYVDGVQTSLDSDGEGFFLDEYYYLGRLAQIADGPLKTGQYYHQGATAHGVFNKVCFSQGGITTELNPNGDGTCSATSRYYEGGELKTGYVSNPTVLLLHMDGIEGGTSFTDSATPPKAATVNGSAAISTDQVKFGTASGVFNSDSDSLTFSAHSQLNFLDQDWTVEFWYYPTDRHGIASSALSVWRDGPVTRAYWFGVLPDGSLFFKLNGDESSDFLSGPMDVVPLNAWSHIAFTRSGSTLRAFLNGNQVGEFQFATPIIDILDTPLAVGAKGSFDNSVKGYLDEVRITKGLARYTSNFTPASEPFTIEGAETGYYIAGVFQPGLDSNGTGLNVNDGLVYANGTLAHGLINLYDSVVTSKGPIAYLKLDEEIRDNAFDSSGNSNHASHFGLGSCGATGAFSASDASCTLEGSSSALQLPHGLLYGRTDLTIEVWFRTNSPGVIFGYQTNPFSSFSWSPYWVPAIYVDGDGKLRAGIFLNVPGFDYQGISAQSVKDNMWHHVVLSLSGTNQEVYLDGVILSSNNFGAFAEWIDMANSQFGWGQVSGWPGGASDYFIGSLDNIAIYGRALNASEVLQHYSHRQLLCVSNGSISNELNNLGSGYCSSAGKYIVEGLQTSLPQSGTGLFNGKYYFTGRLAQVADGPMPDGIIYTAGIPAILGCTDSLACNYNPSANLEDLSCSYTCGDPNNTRVFNPDNDGDHAVADSTVMLGNYAWISYRYTGYIQKRDITDGSFVTNISLPGNGGSPHLIRAGEYVWAFSTWPNHQGFWRIHRETDEVTTFDDQRVPRISAISASEGYLWIITPDVTPTLYKMSSRTGEIVATFDLSSVFTQPPQAISVDSSKIGITGDSKLVFFDKNTLTVVRTIVLTSHSGFVPAQAYRLFEGGDGWFVSTGGDRATIYRYDYNSDEGHFLNVTIDSIEGIARDATGFWIPNTHSYVEAPYLYHIKFDGTVDRRLNLGHYYGFGPGWNGAVYPKTHIAPGGRVWQINYYPLRLLIMDWMSDGTMPAGTCGDYLCDSGETQQTCAIDCQ